ncbi:unnamed protein product [Musa banksii]
MQTVGERSRRRMLCTTQGKERSESRNYPTKDSSKSIPPPVLRDCQNSLLSAVFLPSTFHPKC